MHGSVQSLLREEEKRTHVVNDWRNRIRYWEINKKVEIKKVGTMVYETKVRKSMDLPTNSILNNNTGVRLVKSRSKFR